MPDYDVEETKSITQLIALYWLNSEGLARRPSGGYIKRLISVATYQSIYLYNGRESNVINIQNNIPAVIAVFNPGKGYCIRLAERIANK